jgi:hypothetical protein
MSQRTSTGVFGLIAIPAFNPRLWIYLINFLGLVFSSEVPNGVSAAVDEIAAS